MVSPAKASFPKYWTKLSANESFDSIKLPFSNVQFGQHLLGSLVKFSQRQQKLIKSFLGESIGIWFEWLTNVIRFLICTKSCIVLTSFLIKRCKKLAHARWNIHSEKKTISVKTWLISNVCSFITRSKKLSVDEQKCHFQTWIFVKSFKLFLMVL